MLVELTMLVAAGVGNLAWDLTGRRVSARARRQTRRERRREELPLPADDDHARDPFEIPPGVAPKPFVEHTRATVEELDRVVDHFDLVLLRAEAGESLVGDVVYIGAAGPRERGRGLLDAWLGSVAELPSDVAGRLRDLGLPDRAVSETLERESARSCWPNIADSRHMLEGTATDLEGVVVLLVSFLRTLTVATSHPYR